MEKNQAAVVVSTDLKIEDALLDVADRLLFPNSEIWLTLDPRIGDIYNRYLILDNVLYNAFRIHYRMPSNFLIRGE